MFPVRALIGIMLLLSATVVYAEVAARGLPPVPAVDKAALSSSPDILPSTGWRLQAEQWELARSGETILSLPVLKQLVGAWLADKQQKIEIQYPGGEDGEFWVQELSDWLVSLGIPSKHMVITPGSGADDVIKFNIIK